MVVEKKWMTAEIRAEIGARRRLNRKARNCIDKEEKERLVEAYRRQKWKAQRMVREAVERYEEGMRREMEQGEHRSVRVWKNINTFEGQRTGEGEGGRLL